MTQKAVHDKLCCAQSRKSQQWNKNKGNKVANSNFRDERIYPGMLSILSFLYGYYKLLEGMF